MYCSSTYSYSACGNKENPGSFMNKSVSSPFNWVSIYFLFLAKLNRKERIFDSARGEAVLWDYSQEHLVVIKDEKVCPFVKFEIILPLICCFTFPKWPSCPRNICTEHWRKPPIFLYLKNKDSIQHVQKVLLIVLFKLISDQFLHHSSLSWHITLCKIQAYTFVNL